MRYQLINLINIFHDMFNVGISILLRFFMDIYKQQCTSINLKLK